MLLTACKAPSFDEDKVTRMKIKNQNIKLWGLTFLSALCLSTPSIAQESTPLPSLDLVPKVTDTSQMMVREKDLTHPLIRLTPDKLELVELEKSAISVFVGNPDHLNVLLDTPTTLVLIPRQPGSTYFQVLDSEGNTIYARHAIIASPEENYVRIRKNCALGGGDGCEEYSVYFCPDMCHEVNVPQEVIAASDVPEETPQTAQDTNGEQPSEVTVYEENVGQETNGEE